LRSSLAFKDKPSTSLSEISDVQVDSDVAGRPTKFILVTVSNGQEKKTIFKSMNLPYHDDIYGSLISNLETGIRVPSAGPDGGGRIYLDNKEKEIWVWGESTAFGLPDYAKAEKLLESSYKNFDIIVIPQLKDGKRKSRLMDMIVNDDFGGAASIFEFSLTLKEFGINKEILEGRTLLSIAAEFEKAKSVKELLKLGADKNLKDDKGRAPIDIVKSRKPLNGASYEAILSLLS
jgi:hypothetical protein